MEGKVSAVETKRLDLIALLIVGACILHSICILNGDSFDDYTYVSQENNEFYNNRVPDRATIIKRNNE